MRTTIEPGRGAVAVRTGLAGLVELCERIGEPLHPHERRIAKAYFGPAREVCAILPRGNAKTTAAAKIAVHHLLSTPGAAVTIGRPHATRHGSRSSGCRARHGP